ncbi:hypothetical protein HanIR_Chr13g0663771 [Helianthus annuus]|nr:hypothetical protein HanIR_Chr13g0663771 [Helianthus annuus]
MLTIRCAELELEQQGIRPDCKFKTNVSFYLKPPYLLKVCNCMKSVQKKELVKTIFILTNQEFLTFTSFCD